MKRINYRLEVRVLDNGSLAARCALPDGKVCWQGTPFSQSASTWAAFEAAYAELDEHTQSTGHTQRR